MTPKEGKIQARDNRVHNIVTRETLEMFNSKCS